MRGYPTTWEVIFAALRIPSQYQHATTIVSTTPHHNDSRPGYNRRMPLSELNYKAIWRGSENRANRLNPVSDHGNKTLLSRGFAAKRTLTTIHSPPFLSLGDHSPNAKKDPDTAQGWRYCHCALACALQTPLKPSPSYYHKPYKPPQTRTYPGGGDTQLHTAGCNTHECPAIRPSTCPLRDNTPDLKL
jgi:hypothetical protein